MQTFPKNERLCGKTTIDNLFTNGSFIKGPLFRLVWNTEEFDNNTIAQTLIVVPKKNIKNRPFTQKTKVKIRLKLATFAGGWFHSLTLITRGYNPRIWVDFLSYQKLNSRSSGKS